MAYVTQTQKGKERHRLYPEDLPVHEWYRFVLSFPPHLVLLIERIFEKRHDKLVPLEELREEELERYRRRSDTA